MNNLDAYSVHTKVTPAHLQRLAYIYVRQSSPQQVERHRESQAYQYQMAKRAEALGWSLDRIRVIDTDLGLSGQGSQWRDGFKELVAEVSLGQVGIIFGYEVSRLARNNGDWYHLLDLAAVFATLIADSDGIYDTRLYNDRLLLGLKGTMSEAELHLLRLRLCAGRMNKVRRGAYRLPLPTGLVRLPDEAVIKEPDEQVRQAIELVFAQFKELGSCRQVLRFLRQERIRLPRRQRFGAAQGEVVWKPPAIAVIQEIIHNPAYAGAYVYGRRQVDPTKQRGGRPATGLVSKPLADWLVIQRDAYSAYITWEQYLANQARLQQNSTLLVQFTEQARGAAREGVALLQGLATCGVCGHRMHPAYKSSYRYDCEEAAQRLGAPMCASLYGPSIDEAVVQAFFEAIRPAQLDALEAVLAQQRTERSGLTRQWQQRLTRARYEAQLARATVSCCGS